MADLDKVFEISKKVPLTSTEGLQSKGYMSHVQWKQLVRCKSDRVKNLIDIQ